MAVQERSALAGMSREEMLTTFAQSPQLLDALMKPSKWEKVIYYRKPERYAHPRFPQGRTHNQASWIFWGDSQDSRQLEYMREGNIPLTQFGVISDASPAFNQYGPWGPILTHPQGPSAFPLNQLLTFRWFDPAACPVQGIRFPQLKGMKIKEIVCPECSDFRTLAAHAMGRHLQYHHEYTPQMLTQLSERWSLSFDKDFANKGQIETVYEYEDEVEEAPEQRYQVETEVVRPEPIARHSTPTTAAEVGVVANTADAAVDRASQARALWGAKRGSK